MSESGISLKIGTDERGKAIRLIQGFQCLHALKSQNADEIMPVMKEYFGQSFVDVICREIFTEDQVLQYKRYLKPNLVKNVEGFIFRLANRATNDRRLWQDSYDGDVATNEICPADTKLTTRSATGGSTWDDIELYYDSDENYALKAAVFAYALKCAGFDVEAMSSWDDYEPDYD